MAIGNESARAGTARSTANVTLCETGQAAVIGGRQPDAGSTITTRRAIPHGQHSAWRHNTCPNSNNNNTTANRTRPHRVSARFNLPNSNCVIAACNNTYDAPQSPDEPIPLMHSTHRPITIATTRMDDARTPTPGGHTQLPTTAAALQQQQQPVNPMSPQLNIVLDTE
ncbi:unnamed protein product [Sphagnum balticum]